MAFRDLLTIVTKSSAESAFAATEVLAARWSAQITTLLLSEAPQPLAYAFGGAMWLDTMNYVHAHNVSERDRVASRVRCFEAPARMRSEEVLAGACGDVVARHAAYADLIVMEQPGVGFAREALEAVLYKSGRPVLLAPADWRGRALGRRILVVWSPKREAARAVADAAAFLEEAESVAIVSFEPRARFNANLPSEAELIAHLIRRGVAAHARRIERAGRRRTHEAILDEARAIGADLVVQGAYSRFGPWGPLDCVSRERTDLRLPLFLSR